MALSAGHVYLLLRFHHHYKEAGGYLLRMERVGLSNYP